MAVKTEVTVRTTVVKHECSSTVVTLGDIANFVAAAGKMPATTPVKFLNGAGGFTELRAEQVWTDAPQPMAEKAVSA